MVVIFQIAFIINYVIRHFLNKREVKIEFTMKATSLIKFIAYAVYTHFLGVDL